MLLKNLFRRYLGIEGMERRWKRPGKERYRPFRKPRPRKDDVMNLAFENFENFENKVALVTGAASGMGLATAEAFAAAGAAVALVDLNEQAVRQLADRLVTEGHKALAIACDVTDEAQVK